MIAWGLDLGEESTAVLAESWGGRTELAGMRLPDRHAAVGGAHRPGSLAGFHDLGFLGGHAGGHGEVVADELSVLAGPPGRGYWGYC
jgi:hypothetical protein